MPRPLARPLVHLVALGLMGARLPAAVEASETTPPEADVPPSALSVILHELPAAITGPDVDRMERLLHEHYAFVEYDSAGAVVLRSSREDELAFLRSYGDHIRIISWAPEVADDLPVGTEGTKDDECLDCIVIHAHPRLTLVNHQAPSDTLTISHPTSFELRPDETGRWLLFRWNAYPAGAGSSTSD